MFHQGPEMVTKTKTYESQNMQPKDTKNLHHCKFLHFLFRGDAI